MSNIATSPKTPEAKAENKSVAAVSPTFLQALQDMSTFYGVEIKGSYVKPTAALNGDAYRGSFYVKP